MHWSGAWGRTGRARTGVGSGTVAVVQLRGEIDAANAEDLGRYLRGVGGAAREMVADLTGVTFLGAAGVRQLVALEVDCGNRGAQWVLVADPVLRRLLRVVGADRVLPVSGSLDQALQGWRRARCIQ
ncbi:STAS domain-containing protein [Mycobacterium gordonae]|uniref:STAS domain-containing protein n=1 Tax=Mycobacterium gordonae TaxID=1778 RepID=A0A1X1VK24_MYCGO|nr:STAS domain-containing protein [Mycobacterium gordonae]MCV7009040.1 STAS domain-containing protein [Mycobacterium gordonae]ODR24283.1 hypothetical protein BHQ23_01600 [Mycobacterium gordonae]ORV69318.1 hypothetical protein AWC08_06460 [Mycobacterium gordonae]